MQNLHCEWGSFIVSPAIFCWFCFGKAVCKALPPGWLSPLMLSREKRTIPVPSSPCLGSALPAAPAGTCVPVLCQMDLAHRAILVPSGGQLLQRLQRVFQSQSGRVCRCQQSAAHRGCGSEALSPSVRSFPRPKVQHSNCVISVLWDSPALLRLPLGAE